jgi:cystathionine beta-lyase
VSSSPLQALPLDRLRQRSSAKWRTYGEDVLPLFVAETDFPLAPAIESALLEAVRLGDTGYTPPDAGLGRVYADFSERRFGWRPDPARIRSTCDVMMALVEVLRAVIRPGDRVVVTPPVYPPFFDGIPEAGGVVDAVPLRDTGSAWELDIEGIERAFAAGARAIVLCNPHNPTGTAHDRASLAALASAAARHGAVVISDEIHAPLADAESGFAPFLSVSDDAARVGFALVSASKAFNLAGLKCALMVAASEEKAAVLRALPDEVQWRTGHFGLLASLAAFAPESDAWLDALLAALRENRRLLGALLAEHVPLAGYREPDAGFLTWVDVSAYGWGENPAVLIRREARVALHHGPLFGAGGAGHVRVNIGTSPEILTDAIERIGVLAAR